MLNLSEVVSFHKIIVKVEGRMTTDDKMATSNQWYCFMGFILYGIWLYTILTANNNTPMESFFSQTKEEVLHHIKPLSFDETGDIIDDYVDFYNYERLRGDSVFTPYELRCQYVWLLRYILFCVLLMGFIPG